MKVSINLTWRRVLS